MWWSHFLGLENLKGPNFGPWSSCYFCLSNQWFWTNFVKFLFIHFNLYSNHVTVNVNNLFFYCYTRPAQPYLCVCFWTFSPRHRFFFKRQFLGREEVENSRCQGACHRPWTSFGSTSRRRGGRWLTTLTVVVWSYKRMSWGSWDHRVLNGLFHLYLYYLIRYIGVTYYPLIIDPNLLPTLPAKPSK